MIDTNELQTSAMLRADQITTERIANQLCSRPYSDQWSWHTTLATKYDTSTMVTATIPEHMACYQPWSSSWFGNITIPHEVIKEKQKQYNEKYVRLNCDSLI